MSEERKTGYKNPPVHSRWPEGVSGNPKGREPGHKGLKTDLAAALDAVVTLKNNITGKTVKGRQQRLAVDRLVERAALGDLKAQMLLFPIIMQVLGAEDRRKGPRKLSAHDQQLLNELLDERQAEREETQLLRDKSGPVNEPQSPSDTDAAGDDPDGEGSDADAD